MLITNPSGAIVRGSSAMVFSQQCVFCSRAGLSSPPQWVVPPPSIFYPVVRVPEPYMLTVLLLFLFLVVSAFYAECLRKKIQFNAHIWTKSKFLGMSIGVHNIGQGKKSLQALTLSINVSSRTYKNLMVFCVFWNVCFPISPVGCVSCLEHDEHYILTFPNGYGR